MKTRILTFILSLFLVLSFVGCGDDGGGGTSDSGDSTSTTGTYTIADYVDFSTAQTWIDYDRSGNEETTTATTYSSIGTTLINMYETTSNGDFESYTFEILDSGEYVANVFGDLPFKDAFDEGVLLFPVSMDIGNTITRNYTGVLNGIDVGGTVKVTLDDHYDTFNNGVAEFADVIKYTWVYIDGESTNDPVISLTFYMAKTVGLVKTVDNLEGGYSVRTDLASNVITTDDTTTTSIVPQNLVAADGLSSDYILVMWDAVEGATSYMLLIDDGQGTETSEFVDTNLFQHTDASVNYEYTYTVKAMVDGSWSDPSESDTGYLIGYTGPTSSDSTTVISLTLNTEVNGDISSSDEIWYSFDAVKDNDYVIKLADYFTDSTSYTGAIRITVYREDKSTIYTATYSNGSIITTLDAKDSTGEEYTIQALDNEKVYIKVEPYLSSVYRGTFAITVSGSGSSTTTSSSDGTLSATPNAAIPDGDTTTGVSSTITVSGAVTSISKVTVTINITHTWDNDIEVYLVSPSGTQVELTTDNGSSEDNYVNTVFDDSATTNIVDGSAPFTGTYAPEGSLADFNGEDANGDWTLKVYDDYVDYVDSQGTLDSWSITIE